MLEYINIIWDSGNSCVRVDVRQRALLYDLVNIDQFLEIEVAELVRWAYTKPRENVVMPVSLHFLLLCVANMVHR